MHSQLPLADLQEPASAGRRRRGEESQKRYLIDGHISLLAHKRIELSSERRFCRHGGRQLPRYCAPFTPSLHRRFSHAIAILVSSSTPRFLDSSNLDGVYPFESWAAGGDITGTSLTQHPELQLALHSRLWHCRYCSCCTCALGQSGSVHSWRRDHFSVRGSKLSDIQARGKAGANFGPIVIVRARRQAAG